MTKFCLKCKKNLPISSFGNDSSRKDGLRCYCKICNNSDYRQWYTSNDGKQASKRYVQNHPERRMESRLKWQYKHQENANLKKYGLTKDQYNEMLELQNGTCYICDDPPKTRKLHVDHDHNTGKVRSLLCHRCNTSLGALNEDIAILNKMIEYIMEFNNE